MLNRLRTIPQDRAVELIRKIASRLEGANYCRLDIVEGQIFLLLEKEGILELDDNNNVIFCED